MHLRNITAPMAGICCHVDNIVYFLPSSISEHWLHQPIRLLKILCVPLEMSVYLLVFVNIKNVCLCTQTVYSSSLQLVVTFETELTIWYLSGVLALQLRSWTFTFKFTISNIGQLFACLSGPNICYNWWKRQLLLLVQSGAGENHKLILHFRYELW